MMILNGVFLIYVQAILFCYEVNAQTVIQQPKYSLTWCAVGSEELTKCAKFAEAVTQDKYLFKKRWMPVHCKQAANKAACMSLLDQELADITSLDGGEVFFAGKDHSLIPVLQEIYRDTGLYYYSVAVIKKGSLSDVTSLHNLRNKKACFPNVGSLAGWVIPIYTMMNDGGLQVVDCNNHVKSAIEYFGPSCAINSLIDRYNPIGDNSNRFCEICAGRISGEKCTPADPYAGFEGALTCLAEVGDIAFVKHTTVSEMTSSKKDLVSLTPDNFELLCKDGSRRPVNDYLNCNWGRVPTDALVISSAKQSEVKQAYQDFLQTAIKIYGGFNTTNSTVENSNIYNDPYYINKYNSYNTDKEFGVQQPTMTGFNMSQSMPRYGKKHNLLIQDMTLNLKVLDENDQTFSGYLKEALNAIYRIRHCPVNKMTLCVTSEPEYEKCTKMMIALKGQLLKPEMICYRGRSQIHCMQAIRSGIADVAVFDAGDVYTAGLYYDLIPFMSEVYNLGMREYHVLAVTKEDDPSTELTYLKGKYTCHPGIFTGAGWIIPLAYLISNKWIRSYGCDSARAASEYFSKSCVPGALSAEYASGIPRDNLCHLCHGSSYKYCKRDASEDYYGFTGAFRCLVEGGGDVAFLKHTTVYENTDGKRREWWARNMLNEDFQLLCPDGTRAPLKDYERCSLGKVKANAIVTRGSNGYSEEELNAYINLFTYAQQIYSRRSRDEFSFSMFASSAPYSDLIFQDAAQQLRVIEPEKRNYAQYLGKDFMRARRIVDCRASASLTSVSILLTILAAFYNVFINCKYPQ